MKHNEFHDSFANLLSDVCHDVEIEPHLRPLQGKTFALKSTTTDDDVRLDIKAKGLWELRFNKTYFDVKNFNPLSLKEVAKPTNTMNLKTNGIKALCAKRGGQLR